MALSGTASSGMVRQGNVRTNKKRKETMINKEEPEKLFEIFDCYHWSTIEDLIKEVTDELTKIGYSVNIDKDTNVINIICEHGKICRAILLEEELLETEEFPWTIADICDYDTIKDRCQICRKRKTIQYMFDGYALKFWDKEEEFSGPFEEIDLNDFINWDEINDKAIKEMKEKYPEETIFVDIDEE